MTASNPSLQRIIDKEDFADILSLLTPVQLRYAALRLVGLDDTEIARLCGRTSKTAISATMRNARRSVASRRPDLAHHIVDRRRPKRPRNKSKRVLDWSWIDETYLPMEDN